MEFKFSCKWFEISFSGDPGYVEKQIQLYEPFVFQVLKRIEEEGQKPGPPPPEAKDRTANAPPAPPAAASERPEPNDPRPRDRGWRDRKRRNHFDKNRSTWKDRSHNQVHSRNDPQPTEPTRAESPRPEPEESREDDEKPSPGPAPPEVAPAPPEGTRPYPLPVGGPDSEPAGENEKIENGTAESDEFLSRRRAPRIRAEELIHGIESRKPRTHHDRLMVFGYYMETAGNGSDFTIAEIKRCYRAINQDPGSNIEQVINHAARSGFILRNDKGRTERFKLSSKGRRYVEEGLKLT